MRDEGWLSFCPHVAEPRKFLAGTAGKEFRNQPSEPAQLFILSVPLAIHGALRSHLLQICNKKANRVYAATGLPPTYIKGVEDVQG